LTNETILTRDYLARGLAGWPSFAEAAARFRASDGGDEALAALAVAATDGLLAYVGLTEIAIEVACEGGRQ